MQGLMTTKELGQYLSVSPSYCRERREAGDWREGTHWYYLNPHCKRSGIRYIPELCLNWVLTQSTPESHQEFIAEFQKSHQLSA